MGKIKRCPFGSTHGAGVLVDGVMADRILSGAATLAQSAITVDENGIMHAPEPRSKRFARQNTATLAGAREYILKLQGKKQIGIKCGERFEASTGCVLILLPEITLVYDRDGNFKESRPPCR